jgi:signal transduction histidine kinase
MVAELRAPPSSRVPILAVDDIADNLVALEALLKGPEVEVLKAPSGTAALELLLEHEVALALIDVQMPEMDGFELAELMRGAERTRDVPIIFVTAGTRDPQRAFKGYEAGAVDFMFKPIDPHVLKSKVETFVQLEQNRKQLGSKVTELEEALRLNETVTAVLSHDLRSPLAAILMGTNLLIGKCEEPPTRSVLQRVKASAERMSAMISELLDLARVRSGGTIPVAPRPADLGAICEVIVGEQETLVGPDRIVLSAEGDARGLWDPDRLGQIVSNLLGNALKHGREAQPVRVELDGRAPGHVRLVVRSAGTIPSEILPHVFEPFRRQRTRPDADEGLGLGLFIVDQLVRAHGGTVRVQSQANETVFEVGLPRATRASDAAAALPR